MRAVSLMLPKILIGAAIITSTLVIPTSVSAAPDYPYYCPTHPTLRQGSTGTCVKRVQHLLNQHINAGLSVDGQFGSYTYTKVRALESRTGITVDGVVGPETWGVLERGLSSTSTSTSTVRTRIVSIAQSQVGVRESPLGSNGGTAVYKYTTGRNEAWCADFVSWVYKQAGTPFTGGWAYSWQIPAVYDLKVWFKEKGVYHSRTNTSYTPRPGDVVFFNWYGYTNSRTGNHVGIVKKVSGTTLYTIEGNSSDMVRERTYYNFRGNGDIVGFGHKR